LFGDESLESFVKIHTVRTLLLAVSLSVGSSAPMAAQAIVNVPPGGDLQAAIDAAQPGDTIVLAPGATYAGNFVLRAKPGAAFITIRSATPDAALPSPGQRIDPEHAPLLAKLRSPNTGSALATAPGAHHYRLMFLEFLANSNGAGDVIKLGDGSSRQNSMASVPYELVLDRVYVHGDPDAGQKRAVALNSALTQVINSYISEIKAVGQDSQAIGGWNGPGGYLIANNFLEAAGENVMFGGADPGIAGLVPSDISIVGNHFHKPMSWRGSRWVVKNLLELKNAQRVRVDGNLMENNWVAGQTGSAVLLKSVNQDGGAPWSVVQQVEFTNNVVRHVAGGLNIAGRPERHPAIEANNIIVRNNLFEDVSGRAYGGGGRFLMMSGGAHITIDHNTAISDGISAVSPDGNPVTGFVFTNNVVFDHGLGLKGSGTAPGNATIARYFPGGYFAGNVFAGSSGANYPAANYYASIADVGFNNAAAGDFRLAPGSPFKLGATDGSDPGCDYRLTGGVPAPAPHGGPAPAAPQDLIARVNGSTVTLEWAYAAAASEYILEAGTSPGASNAARVDVGATSIVVNDVPNGTYYVRVRAKNARGASAPSREVAVAVGGEAAQCSAAAPPQLRAGTSGAQVNLSWSAPAGCAPSHYIVMAGSGPGLSNLAQAAVHGAALSATAPAGTYYVRLAAAYGTTVSAASNEIVVTVRP
jgi:hypothetical protein